MAIGALASGLISGMGGASGIAKSMLGGGTAPPQQPGLPGPFQGQASATDPLLDLMKRHLAAPPAPSSPTPMGPAPYNPGGTA